MASLILDDTQIDDDELATDGVIVLNEDDDIEDVEFGAILDVDRVNDGVWVDDVDDVDGVDLVDCLVDAVVVCDVDGLDVHNVDVMLIADVDYVDDLDAIDVCDDVLDDDQ